MSKKESSEIVNFFKKLSKCHVPMVGHMLFFWTKIGSTKRDQGEVSESFLNEYFTSSETTLFLAVT